MNPKPLAPFDSTIGGFRLNAAKVFGRTGDNGTLLDVDFIFAGSFECNPCSLSDARKKYPSLLVYNKNGGIIVQANKVMDFKTSTYL